VFPIKGNTSRGASAEVSIKYWSNVHYSITNNLQNPTAYKLSLSYSAARTAYKSIVNTEQNLM